MHICRLLFLSFLVWTSSYAQTDEIVNDNYEKIFKVTRGASTRHDTVSFFSKVFREELEEIYKKYENTPMPLPKEARRTLSTTQMMKLFQNDPNLMKGIESYMEAIPLEKIDDMETALMPLEWEEKIRKQINKSNIKDDLLKYANPFEPLEMISKDGRPGYTRIDFFANISRIEDGKEIPPDDLLKVVEQFFSDIKYESILNVYDQDLAELAKHFAKLCEEGKLEYIGIDAGVVSHAKEIKRLDALEYYRILGRSKCKLMKVNEVNLNHQKMASVDWRDPKRAKTLLSMGNFTRSGISATGDLPGHLIGKYESPYAKPNVNQMSIVYGQYPALVAQHNLKLGLQEKYNLRGSQFPLSGAYKMYGPLNTITGETPELYMLFTPKGGMNDIMTNFYGRAIRENINDMIGRFKAGKKVNTSGFGKSDEFRMGLPTFAYSSKVHVEEVRQAVLKVYKETGKVLHLYGIGDRPFAMREWSGYGALSGMFRATVPITKDGVEHDITLYIEDHEDPLRIALGKDFEEFQSYLKVTTRKQGFGMFHETAVIDGEEIKLEFTRKLHMKGMVIDDFVIHGTSLNPSDGGVSSREQIIASAKDMDLVKKMWAVVMSLWNNSDTAFYEESVRRNKFEVKSMKEKLKLTDEEIRKVWKRVHEHYKIENGTDCNSNFEDASLSITARIEKLGRLKF